MQRSWAAIAILAGLASIVIADIFLDGRAEILVVAFCVQVMALALLLVVTNKKIRFRVGNLSVGRLIQKYYNNFTLRR